MPPHGTGACLSEYATVGEPAFVRTQSRRMHIKPKGDDVFSSIVVTNSHSKHGTAHFGVAIVANFWPVSAFLWLDCLAGVRFSERRV